MINYKIKQRKLFKNQTFIYKIIKELKLFILHENPANKTVEFL